MPRRNAYLGCSCSSIPTKQRYDTERSHIKSQDTHSNQSHHHRCLFDSNNDGRGSDYHLALAGQTVSFRDWYFFGNINGMVITEQFHRLRIRHAIHLHQNRRADSPPMSLDFQCHLLVISLILKLSCSRSCHSFLVRVFTSLPG